MKTTETVNVYISLEQSILTSRKIVRIDDIATIYCTNQGLCNQIRDLEVFDFSKTDNDMQVITVLKLIEIITSKLKNVSCQTIGCPETLCYYRSSENKNYVEKIKALFLMIIAFFGTGYSIMSYNGDVGTSNLLDRLLYIFTGISDSSSTASILGVIFYSVGLCIGMIVFFNHGFCKNSKSDPTPLQVQMRLYEQDVNNSIILDSSRKGNTIDVN